MSKGSFYGGRWKTGDGARVAKAMCSVPWTQPSSRQGSLPSNVRHERFRNEIDATMRLSHPNIIRLIDHSALSEAGPGDEKPFLVTPIAEGGDLSDADRLSIYTGSIEAVL